MFSIFRNQSRSVLRAFFHNYKYISLFVCIIVSVFLFIYNNLHRYNGQFGKPYSEISITNDQDVGEMFEIYDVVRLIHESQIEIPISENLQRSGNMYDNLCILHHSNETRTMLHKINIHIKHLEFDEILSLCRRNRPESNMVPNRVFYVIFGGRNLPFTFIHFLSFLSVHKFVKPEQVYVVGNEIPQGEWWRRVMLEMPYVKFVYWPQPTAIFGQPILHQIHASDIVRLLIFMIDGGIYIDTDLLVLRSLQPLRRNVNTVGLIDNGTGIGNGFVMTQRANIFLRLWYMSHVNFDPSKNYLGYHSMQVPLKLWKLFPNIVHVEQSTIYRPSWNKEGHQLLYEGEYDWSNNYAVHVWHNTRHVIPKKIEDVRGVNSTLAQIIRHITYSPNK